MRRLRLSEEQTMDHVLFIQKVRPEKRQEYIEAHRQAWPELLKVLRDSGVERELIWIQGDTLYIYVMAPDFHKAIEGQGRTEVFQRWVRKMQPLLAEMQDYSEGGKVVTLEKVFDLEEQLGGSHDLA